MSLLQTALNKSLPYGMVFQGSGEQDPKDKDVRFYQHGLYFKANGELAKDSPHNAGKISLIEAIGSNDEEAPLNIQKEDRAPINPEIVAKLGDKTDEEVLAVAERLLAKLAEGGVHPEFLPELEKREESIRFIAEFAS